MRRQECRRTRRDFFFAAWCCSSRGLAPHLGRSHAHDLVQALCIKAIEQHRPLFDVLAETPEITCYVDGDTLRKLCDATRYLGLSGEMVDRVLAKLK